MNNKPMSRTTVIIIGIAAVIGIVNAVLHIVYETYEETLLLFVMTMLYAILSTICFFMNLHKYRSANKDI